MRLNHIYITKQGEPMANPGMEYPNHLYSYMVEKYHSGLLPFEDSKRARKIVAERLLLGAIIGKNDLNPEDDIIQPDTLIPVDLEVEVVEKRDLQWRCYNDGLFRTNRCSVGNVDACSCSAAGKIVIIKVLRIIKP